METGLSAARSAQDDTVVLIAEQEMGNREQLFPSEGGSVVEFPRILTQDPERVAGEMVTALRRRKLPRVICGRGTRLFLLMQRLVSRRIAINMMGTSSPIRDAAEYWADD